MTTAAVNLNQLAAQWRTARRIYPIYSALLRRFDLGLEPCRELESPINRSEIEVMQRIKQWFVRVDEQVQAFQLRQLLQTTDLGNEESLRALIQRQLAQPKKTKAVRDKIDFLMVQYYAQCSPHGSHEDLSFDHFSDVLHPLVGDVSPLLPAFCSDLTNLEVSLDDCASLNDLLQVQVIEKAREIKEKAGDAYFAPSVLVAVARFNYLLRLGFFRLMHADLHAIRFALHGMELRGQTHCDCSKAALSREEPVVNIRQICHEWKKPFREAYSAGGSFKQLIAIRAAVETALAAPLPLPPPDKKVALQVSELLTATAHAQAAAAAKAAVGPSPKVTSQKSAATASPAKTSTPVAPKLTETRSSDILDLDHCLEQIASQLLNTTAKAVPVTNVIVGKTKLLLASWEVAAFVRGGDDAADALQRAVAVRVLLRQALDEKAAGASVDLVGSVGLAHTEAAQLQERIAEAKDARNIDAAVNLAATAKRLLSLIEEAEKSN